MRRSGTACSCGRAVSGTLKKCPQMNSWWTWCPVSGLDRAAEFCFSDKAMPLAKRSSEVVRRARSGRILQVDRAILPGTGTRRPRQPVAERTQFSSLEAFESVAPLRKTGCAGSFPDSRTPVQETRGWATAGTIRWPCVSGNNPDILAMRWPRASSWLKRLNEFRRGLDGPFMGRTCMDT